MRAASRARPLDHDGDDEVIDGLVALLRATVCRDGLESALEDARRAHAMVPSGHGWRGTTLAVLGLVHAVRGAPDDAEEALAHAIAVTRDLGAAPALSVSLAERGLLALADDDVAGARAMVGEALEIVEGRALEEHTTSGIVFAAAARMAARDGDLDRTRRLATRAQSVRPRLNHAVPHLAVQTRLELAAAALALSDTAGARTLLREMDDIVRLRPGLGRLESEVTGLRDQLADLPMGLLGSSSLTTAELRLLPLLRTHFSFREIGDSLFLSPNTVKTQAISIYRKLGVTSRSDAVGRAVRIGLLDG
nr:LuxR C-terminal-related transcriptional regulator [Salsipaludibacter albus]